MINATPAHAALLASLGPLVMVELLTITLVGGGVLRYAPTPVPISWAGQTYAPLVWERGPIRLTATLEVDNLELTFHPRIYPISAQTPEEEDKIGDLPFIVALQLGVLDGAEVQLHRGDIDPLAGPEIVGALNLFTGQAAEPSFEDGLKQVVKSDLEVFNRQLPANLYQAGCLYTLYDQGCGLNKADWGALTAVAAGSTAALLNCGLAQAAGYFDRGMIRCTSGANVDLTRTVKTYTPGQIVLVEPLLYTPQAGDTFTAWPGCGGTQTDCETKFGQARTVRLAYPFIPPPETAL